MTGEPEQSGSVRINGVTLHVIRAGPENGPPVVLLHGFPEFWYGWRHQIPFLADAGYRVLVPDQRGYNLSEKPKAISDYRLDVLAADVIGLLDAEGWDQVALVGHDWGALVAWWVALKYPERLSRLVILNVPHPAVMRENLRRNLRQMFRSWYIFFLQIPWLPEALSRAGNWRLLRRTLRKSSRPGTFPDADVERYVEAWSRPGALRGMIHWYRALIQRRNRRPRDTRISVPTLMIWGVKDAFLGRELAEPSIALCKNGRLEFIEEATHWVQHEEADRVNALLHEFLSVRQDS